MAMKRPSATALLTTVSPLALLIGSPLAEAADLARKAPPPVVAPPPAYSWTGCYAGAQVGWGWGFNRHSNLTQFSSEHIVAGNQSLDTDGGLFGGQLGCRYQFSGWSPWQGGNWVVGVQGDFAGADIDGKGLIGVPTEDGDDLAKVKTKWIGSVTGSLGVTAWNNQVLFYVKGGGAWTRNQWDLTTNDDDFRRDLGLFDETRSGWTVGVGSEWTLWSPNWTAFVEWNFYQFNSGGTTRASGTGGAPCSIGGSVSPCFSFSSGRQEIQDIKVGVNYRFWGGGGWGGY
jgi:outer membrane immunogenic protein